MSLDLCRGVKESTLKCFLNYVLINLFFRTGFDSRHFSVDIIKLINSVFLFLISDSFNTVLFEITD